MVTQQQQQQELVVEAKKPGELIKDRLKELRALESMSKATTLRLRMDHVG